MWQPAWTLRFRLDGKMVQRTQRRVIKTFSFQWLQNHRIILIPPLSAHCQTILRHQIWVNKEAHLPSPFCNMDIKQFASFFRKKVFWKTDTAIFLYCDMKTIQGFSLNDLNSYNFKTWNFFFFLKCDPYFCKSVEQFIKLEKCGCFHNQILIKFFTFNVTAKYTWL